MLVKFLVSFVLLVAAALGQNPSGLDVVPAEAPPRELYSRYTYDSSGTTYVCWAKKYNELSSVTVSAISNASAAVFTATNHGFHADASPLVTVSGLTGAWAAANGVWRASYVSANSFSIQFDSTSTGAVTGTVAVTTRAPRLNRPVWIVLRAIDPSSVLYSSEGWNSLCSNKENLPYE